MPVQTRKDTYPQIVSLAVVFCALLTALGLLLDTPENIVEGLKTITLAPGLLITDYIALAGPGAAFVNSAMVTLVTLAVLLLAHVPMNGPACATLGLMAGFSLFGKDIANIWPILLGGFLYSRFRRESFGKYASTTILATALSPVVSTLWLSSDNRVAGFIEGCLMGILIGFLLPMLSGFTFRIQKGMNFYNIGFACGLVAMMLVPVLAAQGLEPESVLYWATEYDRPLALFLLLLCLAFLTGGLFFAGRSPREALRDYRFLLRQSGRASCDLLTLCGGAAVLINIGLTGLISTGYILAIGGSLNGPTLAGIFTVMGFAAWGKHPGNMLPVMLGVVLAGLALPGFSLTDPAIQFSILFSTTLAPISGCFGWPFGVLAGFLHICLVQRTGAPVCGLNLYNNGFTGGLIAIVLYGVLTPLGLLRQPEERDRGLYRDQT